MKKILKNVAVFGRYLPHTRINGKRVKDGEPVDNYYPAAIDKKTFNLAQLIRSKRRRRTGRPSKGCGNLFAEICRCGFCGSGMHYVTKSSAKGEVYLVCSKSRYKGGCRYIGFPYRLFETSFLRHVRKIPFTEFGVGRERLNELRTEQTHKEASLNDVEKQIAGWVKIQDKLSVQGIDNSQEISSRFAALFKTKTELSSEIARLAKEMADLQGFDENSRTVSSLLEDENMKDYLKDPEKRHHLKEAIAKMVKRIDIYPAYNLDPRLRHTRHFVVSFADGTSQKCLGEGEPDMVYAKTGNHEASWSKSFEQKHLTLLPSLSAIDSGKTSISIKQMP